jgi:hypothetical protein
VRYIRIDPGTLDVEVGPKPGIPKLTISLAPRRRRGSRIDHPIADAVLFDVLYPAAHEQDRRLGHTGRAYNLVPPDPWLVALGLVMWEGIVQGLSWDVVKLAVRAALAKLRRSRAAPPAALSERQSCEIGFHWTAYGKGKRQHEMFLGLRRKYTRMHGCPVKGSV